MFQCAYVSSHLGTENQGTEGFMNIGIFVRAGMNMCTAICLVLNFA